MGQRSPWSLLLAAQLSQHLGGPPPPQVPCSPVWLRVQAVQTSWSPSGTQRHSPGPAGLSAHLSSASPRGEGHGAPTAPWQRPKGRARSAGRGERRDQGQWSGAGLQMEGLWALLGSGTHRWALPRGRGQRRGECKSSHSQILRKPGRTEEKTGGKPDRSLSLRSFLSLVIECHRGQAAMWAPSGFCRHTRGVRALGGGPQKDGTPSSGDNRLSLRTSLVQQFSWPPKEDPYPSPALWRSLIGSAEKLQQASPRQAALLTVSPMRNTHPHLHTVTTARNPVHIASLPGSLP